MGKHLEHEELGERRDRKQHGCFRHAEGVTQQHGLHWRRDRRTASVVGMHSRIVAGLEVADGHKIGANVDGGGRIARPRRVTLVVEGTGSGIGIGIDVCGIR